MGGFNVRGILTIIVPHYMKNPYQRSVSRHFTGPLKLLIYGTVSSILLLNTDLAVAPLNLASPGILVT